MKFFKCNLVSFILFLSFFEENDCTTCEDDLARVFRTPRKDFTKVNFDHFELLERNNFEVEPTSTPNPKSPPTPKPEVDNKPVFANAQIMLRFGGDDIQGTNHVIKSAHKPKTPRLRNRNCFPEPSDPYANHYYSLSEGRYLPNYSAEEYHRLPYGAAPYSSVNLAKHQIPPKYDPPNPLAHHILLNAPVQNDQIYQYQVPTAYYPPPFYHDYQSALVPKTHECQRYYHPIPPPPNYYYLVQNGVYGGVRPHLPNELQDIVESYYRNKGTNKENVKGYGISSEEIEESAESQENLKENHNSQPITNFLKVSKSKQSQKIPVDKDLTKSSIFDKVLEQLKKLFDKNLKNAKNDQKITKTKISDSDKAVEQSKSQLFSGNNPFATDEISQIKKEEMVNELINIIKNENNERINLDDFKLKRPLKENSKVNKTTSNNKIKEQEVNKKETLTKTCNDADIKLFASNFDVEKIREFSKELNKFIKNSESHNVEELTIPNLNNSESSDSKDSSVEIKVTKKYENTDNISTKDDVIESQESMSEEVTLTKTGTDDAAIKYSFSNTELEIIKALSKELNKYIENLNSFKNITNNNDKGLASEEIKTIKTIKSEKSLEESDTSSNINSNPLKFKSQKTTAENVRMVDIIKEVTKNKLKGESHKVVENFDGTHLDSNNFKDTTEMQAIPDTPVNLKLPTTEKEAIADTPDNTFFEVPAPETPANFDRSDYSLKEMDNSRRNFENKEEINTLIKDSEQSQNITETSFDATSDQTKKEANTDSKKSTGNLKTLESQINCPDGNTELKKIKINSLVAYLYNTSLGGFQPIEIKCPVIYSCGNIQSNMEKPTRRGKREALEEGCYVENPKRGVVLNQMQNKPAEFRMRLGGTYVNNQDDLLLNLPYQPCCNRFQFSEDFFPEQNFIPSKNLKVNIEENVVYDEARKN